jgi:hypothetical protein
MARFHTDASEDARRDGFGFAADVPAAGSDHPVSFLRWHGLEDPCGDGFGIERQEVERGRPGYGSLARSYASARRRSSRCRQSSNSAERHLSQRRTWLAATAARSSPAQCLRVTRWSAAGPGDGKHPGLTMRPSLAVDCGRRRAQVCYKRHVIRTIPRSRL